MNVSVRTYERVWVNYDNRGNRIILPHVPRKAFIESRADVERVKLSLYGTCLYMKPTTVLFSFELE
ncbi:hypothetical protein ALC57_17659 [Trachymyrmex cornetzi]|uniref:Uncharacterized protein n=1 Tax=Trachymyrmex cornetzi TaxID=471704 RepID=A0A151ITB5_9HYME|nr:hypothetical protein ALC57_17659 [Trachymyrmex cornetzi]